MQVAFPLFQHAIAEMASAMPLLSCSTVLRRSYAGAICGPGASNSRAPSIQWVFLGAPGVGKGTYASRAAKHFNIAHIATGDLIRAEIKEKSVYGRQPIVRAATQISSLVQSGGLVPDAIIMEMLHRRLESGRAAGEKGFVLDGFPRTREQAEKLNEALEVQLAFNLHLREEVLVEKCLGRRICRHCGKNYNVADIHLPAGEGRPEIRMPPLDPPAECLPHLETREDDTTSVIRKRLEVYNLQAKPVEDFFRQKGLLVDFEITAGIPETLPSLLAVLQRFVPKGGN